MRSYRHSFHAGNHADVLKHSVLACMLEALKPKPKPFMVLDTHAGAGMFEVKHAHMQKTQEYAEGIARFWQRDDAPTPLHSYLNVIRTLNPNAVLERYPGSPSLSAALLREHDRLICHEWHPSDFPTLKALFAQDRRVQVYPDDAYSKLKAHLPPKERRGVVIIDPSYEVKSEYRDVIQHLQTAHARWATGIYALWYPVVERRLVDNMQRQLQESGIRDILGIELYVQPDSDAHGMTGSGMIVINPPWKLAEQMRESLPWLATHLAIDTPGWKVETLVAE